MGLEASCVPQGKPGGQTAEVGFVGCFRGLCSFFGLRDCNAKARFVQLGGLPRVLGEAQTKVGGLQSNPVCACSLGFLRTI